MNAAPKETHSFQAEVNELLKLVIGSLYSHPEIFLRELVSNAADALDKLRFRSIAEPELLSGEPSLEIRIVPDPEAGTLTIEDTGVGMTHDELVKNLGTIAHSGSKAFLEQVKAQGKGEAPTLIGQFGVGFYSAYLVADRVTVESVPAGGAQGHRWESDARGDFTVEPIEGGARGTRVKLHLKEEHKQYLDEYELRQLVRRYSDYVAHPIKLRVNLDDKSGNKEEFETVNRASALWQRNPSEVTEAEYTEFYKHLTHDFEAPLALAHFRVEGTFVFAGILFVPKRAPFDLGGGQRKHGVRLFVKRVFIMEDCEELLPPWLRFVKGVVDSDDLPLNVSREILQDSAVVRTMRKQVIKRVLDRLADLREQKADYEAFWRAFGPILKEGIALDSEHRDKIAELSLFASTRGDELTTLSAYVDRIKEGQSAIYYAIGESRAQLEGSPYLEALVKKGYEVLLLTDPVDEWAVDALEKVRELPLVSAMRANLKLDEQGAAEKKVQEGELRSLCDRIKALLRDKVVDVRVSDRLTDSAAVLVVPEGGHHAPMEHLLRAAGRPMGPSRRIFEINPKHALIEALRGIESREPASPKLQEWVETLYDQAVLMEGGRIDDPNRFARRVTSLMAEVAAASKAAT